jgi:hypothetical protein
VDAMRRSLARLTLGFSLLLLLGTAAVWARSYREVHTLYFGRATSGTWQVGCDRGRFFWVWCTAWRKMKDRPPAFQAVAYQPKTWARYEAILRQGSTGRWRFLGFEHERGTISPVHPEDPYYVTRAATNASPSPPYRRGWMPAWVLVIPGALTGLLWFVHCRRRRRWGREQRCLGCGYDLRASTDRCPECGRVIPPPEFAPPRSKRQCIRQRRLPAVTGAAAVFVAAAFVAWPLTSARHADRLARRWEVRDPDSMSLGLFLCLARTARDELTPREYSIVSHNGEIQEMLSSHPQIGKPVYIDGDFLYRRGAIPTRIWFDGSVLIRDLVTPPLDPLGDHLPMRWLPAPPAGPTTTTTPPQPLTPR